MAWVRPPLGDRYGAAVTAGDTGVFLPHRQLSRRQAEPARQTRGDLNQAVSRGAARGTARRQAMRQPVGQEGQKLLAARVVMGPQVGFHHSHPVDGVARRGCDGGTQRGNVGDPFDDPTTATRDGWSHNQRLLGQRPGDGGGEVGSGRDPEGSHERHCGALGFDHLDAANVVDEQQDLSWTGHPSADEGW